MKRKTFRITKVEEEVEELIENSKRVILRKVKILNCLKELPIISTVKDHEGYLITILKVLAI